MHPILRIHWQIATLFGPTSTSRFVQQNNLVLRTWCSEYAHLYSFFISQYLQSSLEFVSQQSESTKHKSAIRLSLQLNLKHIQSACSQSASQSATGGKNQNINFKSNLVIIMKTLMQMHSEFLRSGILAKRIVYQHNMQDSPLGLHGKDLVAVGLQ